MIEWSAFPAPYCLFLLAVIHTKRVICIDEDWEAEGGGHLLYGLGYLFAFRTNGQDINGQVSVDTIGNWVLRLPLLHILLLPEDTHKPGGRAGCAKEDVWARGNEDTLWLFCRYFPLSILQIHLIQQRLVHFLHKSAADTIDGPLCAPRENQ